MNKDITWHCKPFNNLSVSELYDIMQLRSAVFVVEQQCVFLDMDGVDKQSHHLFCYKQNELIACCRLMAPDIVYANRASIGRVANAFSVRGSGIGKTLMEKAIATCRQLFPLASLQIGAQLYLQNWYASFGFMPCGNMYLEDDIEHIHMELLF